MQTLTIALVGMLSVGVSLLAAEQGGGRGSGKQGDERDSDVDRSADRGRGPVAIVFAPHDVEAIRSHYASRDRNLPPGLQKKPSRGGTLPPGWEKKLERFPAALERQLVVLPSGHARGVLDGHAVIYNPITHAILDIVTLF